MKEAFNFLCDVLKEGDTVVVGCSAGPDSMCLVDLLLKFRKNTNINIICAGVNHKLRVESDTEMEWLEEFCKKNNMIFEGMVINNYGDDNFHNEARNIRYSFFEGLVRKYDAQYLMTAHHGDDLIETILMRIVRGSTLSGYSGFGSVVKMEGYFIVRPLIYTTKAEILKYDEDHNIHYFIDKSNFSDKYTRNRYRKNVLPFLKKEEPNVHLKFLKYSKTLSMYDDYISKEANKKYQELLSDNKYIDVESFKELDEVIQYKIITNILEDYYQDDLILISDIHTELIRSLVYSKKANTCIYLPNSIRVIKSYDKFYFEPLTEQIDSYEIELTQYANLPNGKNIKKIDESLENTNYYCRLNSSDITLPLHVRTRRAGDKMTVKGLGGSKKVKDIFIDSKIPINKRDLWPVVVDSKENIVWIPGLKKSKFDVPKNKKCDIILKYY